MAITPSHWAEALGPDRVRKDTPLAPFTSFGVGGPADWLLEPKTTDELVRGAQTAWLHSISVTLLGGGSNVLVSDKGVRGLVIRPATSEIAALADGEVRADAGVKLNALVRWTVLRGLGGLEAWAGTPGTVGGAVCGNSHYGGRLIGDLVARVSLLQPNGAVVDTVGTAMAFAYDKSRLQLSGEILLSAVFSLAPGHDSAALRAVAKQSLLDRKRTQPLHIRSAGCAFQNPVPGRDSLPDGCPWSAGALIDRAGLKGRTIGGARVSTIHANFIVNEGGASASDIKALVEVCRRDVLARFGVELRDEIVYLGDF